MSIQFNLAFDTAYVPVLTNEEMEKEGRGPFLIAHGLMA